MDVQFISYNPVVSPATLVDVAGTYTRLDEGPTMLHQ